MLEVQDKAGEFRGTPPYLEVVREIEVLITVVEDHVEDTFTDQRMWWCS